MRPPDAHRTPHRTSRPRHHRTPSSGILISADQLCRPPTGDASVTVPGGSDGEGWFDAADSIGIKERWSHAKLTCGQTVESLAGSVLARVGSVFSGRDKSYSKCNRDKNSVTESWYIMYQRVCKKCFCSPSQKGRISVVQVGVNYKKRQRRPVSRVLFPPPLPARGDDHFSRAPVARRLQRPNPGAARATPLLPYLALLRVGFTEPAWSPTLLVSSYLTVSPLPFKERRFLFCGTGPWGYPPWALPSTLPCGARTFLPPCCHDRRPSGLLWRT